MKILLITVRSDFGGGPRHVDQLINNLPQNIEIYVAYPQDGTPYGQEWNSNSRIKSRINIPFRKFSTKTLFEIAKFIKENSINIVHSHGNGSIKSGNQHNFYIGMRSTDGVSIDAGR